jgi:hypothetical protein
LFLRLVVPEPVEVPVLGDFFKLMNH